MHVKDCLTKKKKISYITSVTRPDVETVNKRIHPHLHQEYMSILWGNFLSEREFKLKLPSPKIIIITVYNLSNKTIIQRFWTKRGLKLDVRVLMFVEGRRSQVCHYRLHGP